MRWYQRARRARKPDTQRPIDSLGSSGVHRRTQHFADWFSVRAREVLVPRRLMPYHEYAVRTCPNSREGSPG